MLVVDDDRALLTTLSDILGLQGYSVETAQRGLEALDLVLKTEEPPLVVLLDVGLPDISGLEIAQRISHHGGVTQVVMLTGDATLESAIAAVRAASVDYLVKPVEPKRLFETIGRASDRALRRSAETALELERRRQSEILEASPVAFAVLTAGGGIEYVNQEGAALLGLNAGEPSEASRRRHVEEWLAGVKRTSFDEEASADHSYSLAGAEERVFSCKVRTLRSREGSEEGALFAFTDVTESRRVEERLRQTQKLEAVGRLAGGVAHDFNNLLTVITAHAELMAADLGEESPHLTDLLTIQEAASQAAAVVGQLLTFSRREPGRIEATDLNAVVRGLHGLLTRTIGRGIALEADLDPTLPAVEADAGFLRQVIMNLAMNARDAMEGGGVLTFRTSRPGPGEIATEGLGAESGLEWVFLDVVDTGHGMDAETRARIFEPFFTTKLEGKGTGLGLATVYGIVSQLGGVIDVTSALGVGTTFRVMLPATSKAIAPQPDTDSTPTPTTQGRTVLIVDDEDGIRTALRRLLVLEGHRVLEASHGREAVEIAQHYRERIDLLMTDHRMPGLPPEQYVPMIVEAHPEVRVMVVTGSAMGDVLAGLEAPSGQPLVLRKPFNAEDVRRAVRDVLG